MDYRNYARYRSLVVESSTGIAALKNSVSSGAVYIIGSGPSITRTDLSKLNGETVIFLNNAIGLQGKFSPGRSLVCLSSMARR